jgi:hypothetical protein
MPRFLRAIGDEFNHRFSQKDTQSANELVGSKATARPFPILSRADARDEAKRIIAKSERRCRSAATRYPSKCNFSV